MRKTSVVWFVKGRPIDWYHFLSFLIFLLDSPFNVKRFISSVNFLNMWWLQVIMPTVQVTIPPWGERESFCCDAPQGGGSGRGMIAQSTEYKKEAYPNHWRRRIGRICPPARQYSNLLYIMSPPPSSPSLPPPHPLIEWRAEILLLIQVYRGGGVDDLQTRHCRTGGQILPMRRHR